ncbi:MAG: hypothetical protein AB7O98_04950 [Hyphomonadaceae bacterium]
MRFVFAALVALTVLGSAFAYACSCRPYANVAEHVADAAIIFRGRVVETSPDPRAPEVFSVTTFELISPILLPPNGEPPPDQVVVYHPSSRDGPQCGIWYEPGQEVLVLARMNEAGQFQTNSCLAPRWPEADYRAVFQLAP